MKTINDILNEQGFSEDEKEVFLSILGHAKTLQKGLALDQLKPYMNQQIDQYINSHEN